MLRQALAGLAPGQSSFWKWTMWCHPSKPWQNTGVGVNRVPMSLRSSLKLMDKWRLYRFVWVCPSLLSRKSFALKGNPATPEQNAFLLGKIRKLQIQKIVTKTCLIRKFSVWICVEEAIIFLQTMNHRWNQVQVYTYRLFSVGWLSQLWVKLDM